MVRGGEIILPELRERREDIPILFYFIVARTLPPPFKISEIKIELSTYQELMSESFRWEGNVRELQTLAREILTVAQDERNEILRTGKRALLTLRGSHVEVAAKNIMRGAQATPRALVPSN
jgi:DNA-binding NtrC family response regulator